MSIEFFLGGGGMIDPIRPPEQGGLAFEIFGDNTPRWPLKIAVAITIIFHLLLFLVVFQKVKAPVYSDKNVLINLRALAAPPAPAEQEGAKKMKQTPKKVVASSKTKTAIPFPDPTPDMPEPLIQPEVLNNPVIVAEVNEELEIGEVVGPPSADAGGGKGRQGADSGERTGPGGPGENIYREGGGGVIPPVLLNRELPSYTEEARRARKEGLVILQAIVDKNGRVTDVQIVKSLDPSLDESAIRAVITKWRFRPATLNGQPVLFELNIEIDFHLY